MEIIVDFGNNGFKIKATVSKEGDRWCVCAGNFAEMPAGFGYTISDAVANYKIKIFNDSTSK